MIVNSGNIEFGYELLSAIPYSYELYLSGKLKGTISAKGSESLYYFSPDHQINKSSRSWFNTEKARMSGLPYTNIHKPEQPDKKFPPYKEHFANDKYKFKKPIVCICNRYNVEWSCKPINYFDLDILDWMFSNLKKKYEIIYFSVNIPEELQDNAHSMKMNDESLARSHGIKIFSEIVNENDWNDTLLKVFANCEHYITMNGGYSILASMFTGTNIIYSKPGFPEAKEIKNKSFWRWYPNINNVRTVPVESYDELKRKIKSIYIDEDPCLNVLIRTHRPSYFDRCYKSLDAQTYENINPVFICDSDLAVEYTRSYNGRVVRVYRDASEPKKPLGGSYGKFFPYNSYLDLAQKKVNGYILCLDDDDAFTDRDSVSVLMNEADKNRLMIFKVDFNDRIIPSSKSFGNRPLLFDITGIGICYHSDHISLTDWSPWKRADYRTAKLLYDNLGAIWINRILTKIQDVPGNGTKKDLNISSRKTGKYKLTYPDGSSIIQFFTNSELKEMEDIIKRNGLCIELQN